MKSNFLNIKKNMAWLAILCLIGCSTLDTLHTSSPEINIPNTPTVSMSVVPTPLSLHGKIAFIGEGSEWGDHRIFVLSLENENIIDITPPKLSFIRHLSWSLDGQFIAFDGLKDNITQIFKISTDGTKLTQLTHGENHAFLPSWSPDGKNILFVSAQQNNLIPNEFPLQQIYTMKSDGTDIRRFTIASQDDNKSIGGYYRTDGLIAIYEPITRYSVKNYIVNSSGAVQKHFPEFTTNGSIAWSPDGKIAIYTADRTTSNCSGFFMRSIDSESISCLNIDNGMTSQTAGKIIGADGASWSPDGKYIIFSSNIDGDVDIYIIKPDGTGLFQITNLPGNEGGAVWWSNP